MKMRGWLFIGVRKLVATSCELEEAPSCTNVWRKECRAFPQNSAYAGFGVDRIRRASNG